MWKGLHGKAFGERNPFEFDSIAHQERMGVYPLFDHNELDAKDARIAELEPELARYRETVAEVARQRNDERAEVERLREALSAAREAMAERRNYAAGWEYKYGDAWDEEDKLIDKALAAMEPVWE
jgi:uncharacterized coiled-coil protein SlyX